MLANSRRQAQIKLDKSLYTRYMYIAMSARMGVEMRIINRLTGKDVPNDVGPGENLQEAKEREARAEALAEARRKQSELPKGSIFRNVQLPDA